MTNRPAATHSYLDLPALCYQPCSPTAVKAPQWVAFNQPLAESLQIPQALWLSDQGLQYFSGNEVPAWAKPVAQAYAGHQFGHFNPQLGDGRAILLSELTSVTGQRVDIQLKGAGRTPYSRGGDGRSPLGPVLREYIVSEAMHNLGIPTTRALAAVVTGEAVYREQPEPGAIMTRIASSHLRIGSVQFVRAHGSADDLKALLDFTIDRHYSALKDHPARYVALFEAIAERQIELVARWMSVGFIHGVMNTDNTSLSGDTIDYGPCAFMEGYRPTQVFSYIDKRGRYAYNRQPAILQWNLARLAESMLPAIPAHSIDTMTALVDDIPERFSARWQTVMERKIGLTNSTSEDTGLIRQLLSGFEQGNVDFTLGFRYLTAEIHNQSTPHPMFTEVPDFHNWRHKWQTRLQHECTDDDAIHLYMNQHNPLRIPRNHRIQEVIEAAYKEGDLRPLHQLQAALENPYDDNDAFDDFSSPAPDEKKVNTTFCGT